MNGKSFLSLGLILIACLLLSGCNLPDRKPETSPTLELDLLATLTQGAVEKENPAGTQPPTAEVLPGPTDTPGFTQPPSPSAPVEIKFQPGGTIAYIEGVIGSGGRLVYTLGAAAGQTLIAAVSSQDHLVTFEILSLEDGGVLVPFSDGSSFQVSALPITGTYQITLTSPSEATYFLSLEVPADLSVGAGDGPLEVGGYIDVLEEFHPAVFTRVRYLVGLEAGKVLNVELQSDALEGLTLALTGKEDGVPYLRHVVKSESIQDFQIHTSQPYYLDVYSISGQSADFSLIIEVSP